MSHSKLSPSSAKRWMSCPRSIRLSEGVAKKDSKYAEEGTAAHHVAEHCLKMGVNTHDLVSDLNTFVNPKVKKWVSQEMFDYVQIYLDTIYNDSTSVNYIKEIEKKYDLSWVYPGISGTVDYALGEFMGTLRVYDLKYGGGIIVEPDENPQQMLYALGAIGENNLNLYVDVELVIVQPRAYHPNGPVRRWRTTVKKLLAWAQEVKKCAKETEKETAEACAGPWCRFCPATPICPEMVLYAADAAKIEFGSLDEVSGILDKPKCPNPGTLSNGEVAKVLRFLEVLAPWAKEVKEYAIAQINAGNQIPGFKLVKTRGHRRWIDEEKVINTFDMLFGDEIYAPRKLKSPAQIEKLKGVDKKEVNTLCKKGSGIKIVPDNEAGHATTLAKEDFKNV